jgi:ketosteroid isomerase-like protein
VSTWAQHGQAGEAETLARLVAYEEIRQLAARYALAVDSRDLDALVGLFVDDVGAGPDGVGRPALRRTFDRSLRAVGVTVLHVGTHVIDLVDTDHATGSVYCRAEVEDGSRWVTQAILYQDRYERRDGRWYFERRRHLLFYGAEVPLNPLTLPDADWPAHHDGRGTVPGCFDTWHRFWAADFRAADPADAPGGGAP